MGEVNRIHFIAIGGSIMHNLAIALHRQGHRVSGSDDVIYGISKLKLEDNNLFPDKLGWDVNRIDDSIDFIILGMHAKADNPELLKAKELDIIIYSFPEYVAKHAKDKIKVVVAGSHGKTTTTSMIMHVLKHSEYRFDYLVGAQLDGFDLMVQLSDAPIIIIEGDEYLSSAIDRRPKFLHYRADYNIITGVEWDHANVFPTASIYKTQFQQFINSLEENAQVYYDASDSDLLDIVTNSNKPNTTGYLGLSGNRNTVEYQGIKYRMRVFGHHNRKNMHAALLVCRDLGIPIPQALTSLESFEGAAMRQDIIRSTNPTVYRDFGHAPSKVRATIEAVVENHPGQRIGVFVELHTYSSMVDTFIVNYAGVFDNVDFAAICFDQAAYAIKQVEVLSDEKILEAFKTKNAKVIKSKPTLISQLEQLEDLDVLLFLSSGNLLGIDLKQFYK